MKNRIRRSTALFFSIAMLGALAAAPLAHGDSSHKCSPGQQGNKHPGFKPGSC